MRNGGCAGRSLINLPGRHYFVMKFSFGFFGTQEHRVFNGSMSKENYAPGTYIKGSLRNGRYQKTRQTGKSIAIIGMIGLALFFVVLVLIAKYYTLLW